eukprot:gene12087-12227_t
MNFRHHQPRALVHTITHRTVIVHYSKGFGATHSGLKGNKAGTKGTAKTPQQVKDWANGEAADIGDLQVVSGSSLASAYSEAGAGGPFFAALAKHAAYLELVLTAVPSDASDLSELEAEAATSTSRENGSCLEAVPGAVDDSKNMTHLLQCAVAALACFAADSGLWRGSAALADAAALSKLAAAQQELSRHQAVASSGVNHRQHNPVDVQPSQTAIAYAKYIMQLARPANELGLMVAAAKGIKATAVFMDYPEHVAEPMQQLISATDRAGRLLGPAGRQAVMDELPRALVKATMVLAPLATA